MSERLERLVSGAVTAYMAAAIVAAPVLGLFSWRQFNAKANLKAYIRNQAAQVQRDQAAIDAAWAAALKESNDRAARWLAMLNQIKQEKSQ